MTPGRLVASECPDYLEKPFPVLPPTEAGDESAPDDGIESDAGDVEPDDDGIEPDAGAGGTRQPPRQRVWPEPAGLVLLDFDDLTRGTGSRQGGAPRHHPRHPAAAFHPVPSADVAVGSMGVEPVAVELSAVGGEPDVVEGTDVTAACPARPGSEETRSTEAAAGPLTQEVSFWEAPTEAIVLPSFDFDVLAPSGPEASGGVQGSALEPRGQQTSRRHARHTVLPGGAGGVENGAGWPDDGGWNGVERRSQDPVARISRELDALCTQAVDSAEIAAGLESAGWTDGRVAREVGLPDVFALAERLFRITPRHQHRFVGEMGNPWTERPLWHLFRGVVFAAPGVLYVTVLPDAASRRDGLVLAAALVLGWAASQLVSYLGTYLTGLARDVTALAWLRAGLLAGAAVAGLIGVTALAGGASAAVAGIAAGQLLYMVAASVLLSRRQEWAVVSVLLPGLAAGLVMAFCDGGTGHLWAQAGAMVSVLLAAGAAAWVTRNGELRRLRTELKREDLVTAGWQGGYGVAAGLLVTTMAAYAPTSVAGQWALLPVIWTMGVAEWQLVGFRRRAFDVLAATTAMVVFRHQITRAVLHSLGGFVATLTVLSVAAFVVPVYLAGGPTPVGSAAGAGATWGSGLAVLSAGWLLGVAFFCALLNLSLGEVKRTVGALATPVVLTLAAGVLPLGALRVDLAPAVAAVAVFALARRTAHDPTRHV